MKRFLLMLPILLVLGSATTLGVAWACSAWTPMFGVPGTLQSVRIDERTWDTTYIQKRFGVTRINFMRGPRYYDEATGYLATSSNLTPAEVVHQQALAGWPLRALRTEREAVEIVVMGRFGHMETRQSDWRRGVVPPPSPRVGRRVLPYDPIWFGLIGNVIVFSAVWWLILIGPFVLRKHLRRRRGRCPQCAYDLRGDLPRGCPECGWGRDYPDHSSTGSL